MDGLAFDDDDDILREIRLVQALNGPWGFNDRDDRRLFLAAAIAEGRASLGAPGSGALTEGAPADLLVLDLGALDRDAILPVDPVDLVFARGTAAHVREVFVAGRPVVTDGRVLGIDLAEVEKELRVRYRSALAGSPFLPVLPPFEDALKRWYMERGGCA